MKMRLPSFAYPENLKVREEPKAEPIPDNIPISELAEQVVRGKVKLSQPQLRMLIELLPFHLPKLQAIALGRLTGEDFATRLDKAVDASNRAKLIKGRVLEPESE